MFEICVLVQKRKTLLNKIVVAVLLAAMLYGFYLGTVISPFIFEVPAVACGGVAFWLAFRSGVEYEYLYFEGDLKITRIKAKRSRKRLMEINMEKVIVMAKKGDDAVKSYEEDTKIYKRKFTSGNPSADVYELVTSDEMGMILIAFEPDEKMLDAMKARYGKKIF